MPTARYWYEDGKSSKPFQTEWEECIPHSDRGRVEHDPKGWVALTLHNDKGEVVDLVFSKKMREHQKIVAYWKYEGVETCVKFGMTQGRTWTLDEMMRQRPCLDALFLNEGTKNEQLKNNAELITKIRAAQATGCKVRCRNGFQFLLELAKK